MALWALCQDIYQFDERTRTLKSLKVHSVFLFVILKDIGLHRLSLSKKPAEESTVSRECLNLNRRSLEEMLCSSTSLEGSLSLSTGATWPYCLNFSCCRGSYSLDQPGHLPLCENLALPGFWFSSTKKHGSTAMHLWSCVLKVFSSENTEELRAWPNWSKTN